MTLQKIESMKSMRKFIANNYAKLNQPLTFHSLCDRKVNADLDPFFKTLKDQLWDPSGQGREIVVLAIDSTKVNMLESLSQ